MPGWQYLDLFVKVMVDVPAFLALPDEDLTSPVASLRQLSPFINICYDIQINYS